MLNEIDQSKCLNIHEYTPNLDDSWYKWHVDQNQYPIRLYWLSKIDINKVYAWLDIDMMFWSLNLTCNAHFGNFMHKIGSTCNLTYTNV